MALSFGLSLISEAITAGGASLNLPLAGATALDSRVTFTRASTATYVGSDGLLKTAAVNEARLVYDPATLAAQGLLVEEQRTNLLIYSQAFDNAVWDKGTGSINANSVVAPDGTTTADAYTWAASTNNFAYLVQSVAATSTNPHSFSLWMKRPTGTGSRTIRLSVSDVTTSTVVSNNLTVNTSWQRFDFSRASSTNTGQVGCGLLEGNTGTPIAAGEVLEVWGAQLEAGAFATSYIPTTTAQATRAADVATMTGTNFSSWYNQTEGTFVTELSVLSLSGFAWPLIASADTDANRMGMYKSGAFAAGFIASAGAAQMEIVASPIVANTPFKMAVSAQANSGNFSFNGGIGETDTSIAMPTVNRLSIGVNQSENVDFLNGTIKSITYYPRRLANTELQALTS